MTAKLDPPFLAPWLLPRQHLVERLTTETSKLALISAPAGWGKTSLLAAWHQKEADHRQFAFVHLEPDDDDLTPFWAYLTEALGNTVADSQNLPDVEEPVARSGVDPMRRTVSQLINDLHSVDKPLVLVLDDYQVITRVAIHESVLYLIDHLPPRMKVAIATRVDPPFPLTRWRASGEMTELRAKHLRLREEEAARLLEGRFGVELDARSLSVLCRRTEGWPAGLQLAGLALQEEEDRRGLVQRFAGDDRNIADYLTEEVLSRLPPDRVRFLLHTSVLDRLCGPLCDEVADATASSDTLQELEQDNLFLVPLDHQRSWYRYHHLFRDWVRHELRRTQPDLIPELHRRASRWLSSGGHLEEAIQHAIAAGDLQQAGEMMDRYLAQMADVNWPKVFRWLDQLPRAVKEAHPMVAIAEVRWAFTKGDIVGGRQLLPIAEQALQSLPEHADPGLATYVQLFTALGELVGGDIDKSRVLFEALADQERTSTSPAFAMAAGYGGTAVFWAVGPLRAIPALREGVLSLERASLPDTGATALLAAAYAEIGDWDAAKATAEDALALPPPYEGYPYPFRMPAHYALGQTLVAQGDQHEGIEQIRIGLTQARAWVEPIFIAYGCLLLADALEDFSEKRALVREARTLIDDGRGRGRIVDLVAAAELKLSLRQPSQRTPGTVHVEPLTDRERDVVRWLRSELSLSEIAREMYISYNTVKGHTKSIYRKLGVTSRTAAVETADQLDLV